MRPPPIETWPEWANYCAEELSASWYFYAEKPRYMELVGGWISKGRCELVPRVTVSAKDSLIGRPIGDGFEADLNTSREGTQLFRVPT